MKLKASRLLLDNVDNTFTTPVYNGSASLRNAAGQLIEDVTKSVRRKETVDAAYMAKLYDSVTSLYRLDQRSAPVRRQRVSGAAARPGQGAAGHTGLRMGRLSPSTPASSW